MTDPLQFVVGDEENCSFNKVIRAVMDTPVSSELNKKWKAISLMLNTDRSVKEKLKKQQLFDTVETIEILDEILQEWRSRCDMKATLEKLIEIFEYYQMNEIAKRVKKEFNIPDTEDKEDVKEDAKKFPISEESSNMRENLQYYMADLVDHTSLSDELLDSFEEYGVLICDQVVKLKSTRNCEDKNLKFYLFVTKSVLRNSAVYDELIDIFMEDNRNHRDGIPGLLNRYFD